MKQTRIRSLQSHVSDSGHSVSAVLFAVKMGIVGQLLRRQYAGNQQDYGR